MRRHVASGLRRIFGRRGSASFGAAALGVVLLAGAALGSGLARTAVDVTDGLTWLPDNPRGEVVQVNPGSGRPETRLQVSGGDAQLDITQKDGLLVVLDRRTGQITSIDLATLLASGRRSGTPGATSKVLVSDGRVYIVDRAVGAIHNADPTTLVDVGPPWQAGGPLADAVVDDKGVLWAVDQDGTLHALTWSDPDSRFVEQSSRRITGAGPHTVLVPHHNGVTLLDLGSGVVVQEGTGQDVNTTTLQLPGDVLGARTSPAALVPAAVPDSATVVIVTGDRVIQVDVGALGCAKPGRPVVFRDKVYVPCLGENRVVLIDRSGQRAGPDVRTSGSGDPELTVDGGQLFINTPGGDQGVLVDADGNTSQITVRSPDLPVVNPDRPPSPTVPVPPPPRPPRQQPDSGGGTTSVAQPTTGPSSPPPSSSGPGLTNQLPSAPPGVTVALQGRTTAELTLTVSWGAAADNGNRVTGYSVVASGGFPGGSRSTQTTGTSAQLTVPCGGSFCSSGRLDVSVTAANNAGTGPPGTGSWTVPPQGTTPPPPPSSSQPPPPPSTTQQPPPPPPPSSTTPPPPPPATVPTAGSVVITGVANTGAYSRKLALTPPSDWATHNGSCEVVNKTFAYQYSIACSATSVDVDVDVGVNQFVVRAHARDGSRSVDSAVRSVRVIDRDPMCGKVQCFRSDVPAPSPVGPADAGLGLLAAAALFGIRDRWRSKGNSTT
ncbi:fibronectin type III domain-containing protein [Actinocrispum wychmicini]|uniref:Fibronectin type-III domain-containing protein n=1 Tax=Actinocrispum wychmicini TaxID=1213861 RepID=A0A4R2J3T5_9PSEU|nr:fibronectin type III domain-containing protein [Actinocrispum wychmicini]TCO52307.1 hypothetical protein EV192_11238 [Actinocrispum wychmicini]